MYFACYNDHLIIFVDLFDLTFVDRLKNYKKSASVLMACIE